jgi:hypothetical protein
MCCINALPCGFPSWRQNWKFARIVALGAEVMFGLNGCILYIFSIYSRINSTITIIAIISFRKNLIGMSMHSAKYRSVLATTCALAIVATTSAMAVPITFAQYIQTNGVNQQWNVSTTGGATTVSAAGQVFFSFSGIPGVPFSGPEPATFTFNATSGQFGNCGVNCGPGDSFVQPGFVGTFSFIDNGLHPGANLLSGTFAVTGSPATTGGQFSSSIGSSGGSFNASATAGNLAQLVLTSTYLTFLNGTQENASWSLSSLIPNFTTGPVTGGNHAFPGSLFNAAGSGTFSVAIPPEPIAEPSTFGLIALALSGLAMVRRVSEPTRPL